MRARASELGGALRTVFFQQMLGGGNGAVPPVAHFEDAALLPPTSFTTVPQGTVRNLDWSARYFAQVYIEQAGSYTLALPATPGRDDQRRHHRARAARSAPQDLVRTTTRLSCADVRWVRPRRGYRSERCSAFSSGGPLTISTERPTPR